MSRLGIDVSHRIAWPSRQECAALGVGLVRTVCYDADELERAVADVIGTVDVCALIETQTNGVGNPFESGDWGGAAEQADRVSRIGGVEYVEMFNELDLWGVPVDRAAQAAIVMAPIIARNGKRSILTSVVSAQWQEYVQRLADLLPAEIRALVWGNAHPYGRRANGFPSWFGWGADGWEAEAAYALARVNDLTGLPTVATESGIKLSDANHDNDDVEDIGDDQAQATFVGNWCRSFLDLDPIRFPFACYFSWADIVGQTGEQGEFAFGLRNRDWQPRPAWSAFAEAAGAPPLVPMPGPLVPMPGPLVPEPSTNAPEPPVDNPYGLYVGDDFRKICEARDLTILTEESYFGPSLSCVMVRDQGGVTRLLYWNNHERTAWLGKPLEAA